MGTFKRIFLNKKAIVIELIVVILLAVGLWFLINKLSNNFTQDVDMELINSTDSTMMVTPSDGTDPSDHDAKKNAYYALYNLINAKSFVAHSSGETVTAVAVMNVNQKIKAMRVVNNGEVYKESLSHSSFKGVGVRNYIKGENYVTLNATSVNSVDEVTWDTTAKKISKDDYVALYGYVPNGITSYIFSDDTILSAEYLGEENGVFSYRYELDTVKSVAKLSLEMRTMAGTASLPIFERVFVTIRMDKDWKVLSTTTDCTYKVDMLGGVTCTEAVTEVFSKHGENVEIPNAEFFRGYVDDEVTSVTPAEKTATDYLMAGFGDYITGTKPLKVSLNVASSDEKLPLSVNADAVINVNMNDLSNLSAFINVNELTYDGLEFNDLNVAYKKNDIYLKWNDIKAKANIDATVAKLQSLLPKFGVEMPSLDLGEIDTESLLSGATISKDGNKVAVNLPLSLGSISINATLNFTEGDTITFTGATAEAFGLDITLTPNNNVSVDTALNGYSDLLPLLDVIDANGNIGLNLTIGEMNAQAKISLSPLALDLKLGDITAKLSDKVIYINYGAVKAKLALSDIDTILTKLSPILTANGVTLPTIPTSDSITDINVNEILAEVLGSLTTEEVEGGVAISANVMKMPISILLSNTDNKYTIDSITASIDETDIVVEPTNIPFTAISDTELDTYASIATLLDIIDEDGNICLNVAIGDITALVKINLTNFDIDAQISGIKIGETTLDTITAKLNDKVIYINYGAVKAKLALSDIDTILAKLSPILTKLSPILEANGVTLPTIPTSDSITDINVNEILAEVLGSLTTEEVEGGVEISANVMKTPISILLSNTDNKYTIDNISTSIQGTNVVIEPADKDFTFTAISDTELDTYASIATLLDIIDKNNDIHLSVLFDGADIRVTLNLDDLVLTATYEGLEVYADLKSGAVYLKYPGVLATVNINDADYILSKLKLIIAKFADTSAIEDLNFSALTSIKIDELLESLTIQEADGNLVLGLNINGVGVSVTLSQKDGLRLEEAVITMGDTGITVIVLDEPNEIPEFDLNAEYSDVKALVDEFSDIITSILYSDSLSVKVGGTITSGDLTFTILDSDITIKGLNPEPPAKAAPMAKASIVIEQRNNVTGEAFTHTITLIYKDPSLVSSGAVNVYFTYDNSLDGDTKLEGTFTTTKAGETWNILKEIYKQMPALQEALGGILAKDENGYPTLPKFEFAVTDLIKTLSYKDGLLSGYLDTSVIMDSLPTLLGAEIRKIDNSLNVVIPTFTMGSLGVGLSVDVIVPEANAVTDDDFSFDTTNASDFSSINELLKTLANTAANRSFHITGDLSAGIKVGSKTWNIADGAVTLDIKLDVNEGGETYAKVVITRKDTCVWAILGYVPVVWKDHGGTSTLYFDAENELIYVHIQSKTSHSSNEYSNTYYTYTVEEYTANLMDNIFDLLMLSDLIVNEINKADSDTSTTDTTPATVENTLLNYAYGPNKEGEMTFTLGLDLEPLTGDVRDTTLNITHDNDMKLSNLNAKVNIIGLIDITLNAKLESQGIYQGVMEDIDSVRAQYPTK